MLLASSDAWGTDWTRAVNLITYEQGVEPFRLTDRISKRRASLMGRVFRSHMETRERLSNLATVTAGSLIFKTTDLSGTF